MMIFWKTMTTMVMRTRARASLLKEAEDRLTIGVAHFLKIEVVIEAAIDDPREGVAKHDTQGPLTFDRVEKFVPFAPIK